MNMTDVFIADLERDAEATRKVLQRVPMGHARYKPHEKSMELDYLVFMVATMVEWVDFIVNKDELDIAPAGGSPPRPKVESNEQLLELHSAAMKKAVAALKSTNDEHLMTHWKLLGRGKTMMDLPRHVFIRDTVIQHLAHHRGQLTVYLRMLSASVPAIYGPSADEGKEIFA